jgi:hypothetical protein
VDVSIADFMLRLLLGIKNFDETFFNFFQCGDLDLIKPGDKSYDDFLNACLKDLTDLGPFLVDACYLLNPYLLLALSSVSQLLSHSVQTKKVKKPFIENLSYAKKVNFSELNCSQYVINMFN